MSKEEFVEVTIRVPKNLLDLLEAEHYFGWKKQDFFVAAVKGCISAEVSESTIDEIGELRRKYGDFLDEAETVRIVEHIEKSVAL